MCSEDLGVLARVGQGYVLWLEKIVSVIALAILGATLEAGAVQRHIPRCVLNRVNEPLALTLFGTRLPQRYPKARNLLAVCLVDAKLISSIKTVRLGFALDLG